MHGLMQFSWEIIFRDPADLKANSQIRRSHLSGTNSDLQTLLEVYGSGFRQRLQRHRQAPVEVEVPDFDGNISLVIKSE